MRSAYLFASSTRSATPNKLTQPILIDNSSRSVVLGHETASGIGSYNYWTDITTLVKTKLDNADATQPAVRFWIYESEPDLTAGAVMVVIWEDPNEPADKSVVLMFGGSKPTGDHFNIDFLQPITQPQLDAGLELSLGIADSYQVTPTPYSGQMQYSTVDINGGRLTSSAGGYDDGGSAVDERLTVGAVDDSDPTDSSNNPPDPNALPPTGLANRSDDELYDLRPFVDVGDRSIQVDTVNPSADDNLFLATLVLSPSASTGIGEPGSDPRGITSFDETYGPLDGKAWNGVKVYLSSARHADSGQRGECMPGFEENVNSRYWNYWAAHSDFYGETLQPFSEYRNLRSRGYQVVVSANDRPVPDGRGAQLNRDASNNWGADVHLVSHTNATRLGCQQFIPINGTEVISHLGNANGLALRDALVTRLDPALPGNTIATQSVQLGEIDPAQTFAPHKAYVELIHHTDPGSQEFFSSNQTRIPARTWRYGWAVDTILNSPRG